MVELEISEPLEEAVPSGLAVPPEGDFWGLELVHTVPLRAPVRVDELLPERETVWVPDLEAIELLLSVAPAEVLFDTEADAVHVVDPVLVRDPVCDPVVVVVPEAERDAEGLSDHSALVEGWAEPL